MADHPENHSNAPKRPSVQMSAYRIGTFCASRVFFLPVTSHRASALSDPTSVDALRVEQHRKLRCGRPRVNDAVAVLTCTAVQSINGASTLNYQLLDAPMLARIDRSALRTREQPSAPPLAIRPAMESSDNSDQRFP